MDLPPDLLAALEEAGFAEHAQILGAHADRIPCEYTSPDDPQQRRVRIRRAIGAERSRGGLVAEVVSRGGAAEVVYPRPGPTGRAGARTVTRRVALEQAAWEALERAGGGDAQDGLRAVVHAWLATEGSTEP